MRHNLIGLVWLFLHFGKSLVENGLNLCFPHLILVDTTNSGMAGFPAPSTLYQGLPIIVKPDQ